MPKDNIDYSETTIYKISCKDDTIKDVYVGHTTNFNVRKYHHKNACNNFKIDLNIYKTIRDNGGWDNWNMVEIAKYNCKNATEARIKEQEHYEMIKSSLNSCRPYKDIQSYCVVCNMQCDKQSHYNSHINCNSHNKNLHKSMKQNETNLVQKSSEKFKCECCYYSTCRKSQYTRHLETDKHKMKQNGTFEKILVQKSSEKFQCICGIHFNSRTTLWRHKKICKSENKLEEVTHKSLNDDELIIMLVQQNKELLDIVKNGTNNNSHNTTNSHNKSFNLQFFLNETCKHAMNITDFVKNMKLELDDLENTGRTGYVEGISKIVIKNLNKMEQHMRPLHCSDQKREILYIKDNNEWTKETEEKPILTKAIKTIAYENIKQINKWKNIHPDCTKSNSNKNDLYLKIVSNSMNGLTKEESETNINKIITNVAKNVIIEK